MALSVVGSSSLRQGRRSLLHRLRTSEPPLIRMSRPSSNLADFQKVLKRAKNVVILTGAGVSAESGVPTFRGAGGLWRRFAAQDLASPTAFHQNPSLVWEFYHYRRELMRSKEPNRAHLAIAEFEKTAPERGQDVTVITQNIDELHKRAGSKNILELHGSLFRVRCTKCGDETENYDSPICKALDGKGAPDMDAEAARIPVEELPSCRECGGLLRPAVVWFGEGLDHNVMDTASRKVDSCDVCLVVGTSSIVYPAAMFAPHAASQGAVVAEFNVEDTPVTLQFQFHFQGPCGQTLPEALKI